MKKLSIEEKLRIANSGGSFKETGNYSWEGNLIRKKNRYGEVVEDWNGALRILVVKFKDNTVERITLNNIGRDPASVHEYEWYSNGEWYRF